MEGLLRALGVGIQQFLPRLFFIFLFFLGGVARFRMWGVWGFLVGGGDQGLGSVFSGFPFRAGLGFGVWGLRGLRVRSF